MKGLFAILLSLLLIATQTAFLAGNNLSSQTQNKTGAHHCCKAGTECHMNCCVVEEVPNSTPAPIAPTRNVSQTDSSLVSVPVQLALQIAAPARTSVIVSDLSLRPLTAAPLYERNCSYLL